MPYTVDTLQIDITASSTQATKSVNSLAKCLENLRGGSIYAASGLAKAQKELAGLKNKLHDSPS